MSTNITIGRGLKEVELLGRMANRHGLIAGATGTGKTVTLKILAEGFSRMGVPVFLTDVKGDLAGLAEAGLEDPRILERAKLLDIAKLDFQAFPTTFWDVFGEQGHPVRSTISEMGPMLLSRLLQLNETQAGVLALTFKIADDHGFLLLDLKDLRSMIQHVGDHAKEYTTEYGNISTASVGAIQRGLFGLEEQGGDVFFGEPALNLQDLIQTDRSGRGMINILAADRLLQSPKIYSTFLLWLLSELFESLPEAGDLDKPKLVFFFDEAHLLFDEAPKSLLQKIEQVVRLIRSKGVGIYFVTQSPLDIPDEVLGQLGNRVQHALRAFTAKDQKSVRAAAETFRGDGKMDIGEAITQLAIGEALVSCLDDKGSPGIVERAFIYPPLSRLGPITLEERNGFISRSLVRGYYEQSQDRPSAFEMLKKKAEPTPVGVPDAPYLGSTVLQSSQFKAFLTSAARTIGTQVGRQIFRGVLGSLLGGTSKSNSRRR